MIEVFKILTNRYDSSVAPEKIRDVHPMGVRMVQTYTSKRPSLATVGRVHGRLVHDCESAVSHQPSVACKYHGRTVG